VVVGLTTNCCVVYIEVCVNVSYLPDQYGFSLVLTLNHVVLINETISGE